MQQFNRFVEVLIADAQQETALEVRDLRVVFMVEKKLETGKEGANSCSVQIYNLNQASRNAIKLEGKKLILKAGYKDTEGTKIVYRGDIDNIAHTYNSPDIITTIDCQDKGVLNTRLSRSYKAGTSAKNVLNNLISDLGVPIDADAGVTGLIDKVFNQGFSFATTSAVALNKVTDKLGVLWSLQNGQLKFTTREGTDQKTAVVLSPSTGLIESPIRELKKINKSEQSTTMDAVGQVQEDMRPSMQLKCLLQPSIEPGNKVQLQSREYDSTLKVIGVAHNGDTHGSEWTTSLECEDV